MTTNFQTTPAGRVPGRQGGLIVMGLLVLGLLAAGIAVAYQRGQTRRCLAFYGPAAAAAISRAPTVELRRLAPGGEAGRLLARGPLDISRAKGLVHLRRGLVEDANFVWPSSAGLTDEAVGAGPAGGPADRLPAAAWDWAMTFSATRRTPGGGPLPPPVTLVIDLEPQPDKAALSSSGEPALAGHLAIVGRGGRVRLGRIGPGLQTWIEATLAATPDSAAETPEK
jgi:hypothetical protein